MCVTVCAWGGGQDCRTVNTFWRALCVQGWTTSGPLGPFSRISMLELAVLSYLTGAEAHSILLPPWQHSCRWAAQLFWSPAKAPLESSDLHFQSDQAPGVLCKGQTPPLKHPAWLHVLKGPAHSGGLGPVLLISPEALAWSTLSTWRLLGTTGRMY